MRKWSRENKSQNDVLHNENENPGPLIRRQIRPLYYSKAVFPRAPFNDLTLAGSTTLYLIICSNYWLGFPPKQKRDLLRVCSSKARLAALGAEHITRNPQPLHQAGHSRNPSWERLKCYMIPRKLYYQTHGGRTDLMPGHFEL